MKKQLLTLEATIDQLRSYKEMYISERWVNVVLQHNLLKTPLTVGQFIAAKDGKPMSKPGDFENCDECDLLSLDPCNCACESIAYDRYYQAAEKAVIFKGWELVPRGESFYLQHENWVLSWYGGFILTDRPFGAERALPPKATWKHLAEATESNPITLNP